jgi:hypothetical protein
VIRFLAPPLITDDELDEALEVLTGLFTDPVHSLPPSGSLA